MLFDWGASAWRKECQRERGFCKQANLVLSRRRAFSDFKSLMGRMSALEEGNASRL